MTNSKVSLNGNIDQVDWSLKFWAKNLPLSNIEKTAAFLYIVALLGGLAFFQRGKYTEFIPAASLVYPLLYIYFFIKFLTLPRVNLKLILMLVPFGGLVVSAFLSFSPFSSLVSIVSLLMNTIFAFWISSRVGRLNFLIMTLVAVLFLHIMAIPVGLFDFNYVIYNDPMDRASLLGLPNYEALFPHKIQAGIYSALGALIALKLFFVFNLRKYLYLSVVLFVFNLASGSSLAFSSCTIAVLLAFSISRIRLHLGLPGVLYFIIWASFLMVCFFYFDVYETALRLLGRDPGLTGRTEIWKFGLDYISKHPIFGGGFGVFFAFSPDSPAQELWSQMRWYKAPSFHNGYIELFAEGGLIPAFSFLFVIGFLFWSELKSDKVDFFSLTIILVLLVANVGAAVLIKANVYLYVLLMVLFFSSASESKSDNLE